MKGKKHCKNVTKQLFDECNLLFKLLVYRILFFNCILIICCLSKRILIRMPMLQY